MINKILLIWTKFIVACYAIAFNINLSGAETIVSHPKTLAMDTIKFLTVLAIFYQVDCYLEVFLTSAKSIYPGDKRVINFDNIRVKRVNRSDHLLIGTFEAFVELGNNIEVSENDHCVTPFLNNFLTVIFFEIFHFRISRLRVCCTKKLELAIRNFRFTLGLKNIAIIWENLFFSMDICSILTVQRNQPVLGLFETIRCLVHGSRLKKFRRSLMVTTWLS